MKVRTRFVSNSSFSSFLLAKKNYDGPASILYRNYGDVLGDTEALADAFLISEIFQKLVDIPSPL